VLPTDQPNTEFFADSAGNPDLRPELATGIDLAVERYLEGGGVISANLFHRRISNLIRGRTELEAVPWSSFERWVRRSRNIGDASTTGLELDTKFRLDQLVADAPRVETARQRGATRARWMAFPAPTTGSTSRPCHREPGRRLPAARHCRSRWAATSTGCRATTPSSTWTSRAASTPAACGTCSRCGASRPRWAAALGQQPRAARHHHQRQRRHPGGRRGRAQHQRDQHRPSYVNWQLRLELKL
jgi:outer membrane receptor for ferrienterochelin and colicins